jgi:hypothetical protein
LTLCRSEYLLLHVREILRHVFGNSFSSRREKTLSVEPELAAQRSGRVRLADRIDRFTFAVQITRSTMDRNTLWLPGS